MYFAAMGAATAPDNRGTAKVGNTSKAVAIGAFTIPSPLICSVAVSRGVEADIDSHNDSTLQPGSLSVAFHPVRHPALIESIAVIASSPDMPGIDISPACLQQLEAE
jgi:hypothetical protein